MDGKRLRLGLGIVLLILISSLVVEWINPSFVDNHPLQKYLRTNPCPSDSVLAYLPTWGQAMYKFAGEGIEFAAFTRRITYAAPELLQIEDLSGTNLVKIVELTPNELRVVWTAEEFYEDRNLLKLWLEGDKSSIPGRAEALVPLQGPLRVGTSWTDDRYQREIVQVKQVVTVPLGTFYDVLVVESKALGSEDWVQHEYYAKNMGLIKREARLGAGDEDLLVISALEELNVGSDYTHVHRRN